MKQTIVVELLSIPSGETCLSSMTVGNTKSVACAVCRQATPLDKQHGIKGLPKNYELINAIGLIQSLHQQYSEREKERQIQIQKKDEELACLLQDRKRKREAEDKSKGKYLRQAEKEEEESEADGGMDLKRKKDHSNETLEERHQEVHQVFHFTCKIMLIAN